MRIAVIGAAAAAMLGGTLAVLPISSISTPASSAGCGGGCQRLAAVLIPAPDAPPGAAQPAAAGPSEPAAQAAPAAPGPAQVPTAANVIAPGLGAGPDDSSAASAVPGVAGPGVSGPESGASSVTLPGGETVPNISDVYNDPRITNALGTAETIAAVPAGSKEPKGPSRSPKASWALEPASLAPSALLP